jgi:DNA-binding PadR family transcriptional regulator
VLVLKVPRAEGGKWWWEVRVQPKTLKALRRMGFVKFTRSDEHYQDVKITELGEQTAREILLNGESKLGLGEVVREAVQSAAARAKGAVMSKRKKKEEQPKKYCITYTVSLDVTAYSKEELEEAESRFADKLMEEGWLEFEHFSTEEV